MANKNLKNALFLSVISMMLCVTMLIGSTFAWFTDTATTAVNNIVSGTLDIEIVDEAGEKLDRLSFMNVENDTELLWEPGVTFKTGKFYLENIGNLWLKCKVEINNTAVSYNKLNEVIDFTIVDSEGNETNIADLALAPADKGEVGLSDEETEAEPQSKEGPYYIKAHMDEKAGNEYQGLTLEGVAITVYATQYTAEKDMKDDQYDAEAKYDDDVILVKTADEFINAFANLKDGAIIALTADIDLDGKVWTPVEQTSFTLDGDGNTISNMSGPLVGTTASKEYTIKNVTFKNIISNGVYGSISNGGIIGYADTCSYINMTNVTIDGATVTGAEFIGGFVGYTSGYNVDNNGPVYASHKFISCTIKNAKLTSTTDGSVGGLIGHAGSNAATTTRVNDFAYENLTLVQTNADRPEKTGNMIGTCNVGVVYITDADIDVATDIGRFVPGTTGKLVINGTEQTEFANTDSSSSVEIK